jgi:hypothetical protein
VAALPRVSASLGDALRSHLARVTDFRPPCGIGGSTP